MNAHLRTVPANERMTAVDPPGAADATGDVDHLLDAVDADPGQADFRCRYPGLDVADGRTFDRCHVQSVRGTR